jgi:hypothetical protein
MKTTKGIAALAALLLLCACGRQPVPRDKLSYVGEWTAPDMYLLLLPEGRVTYERNQGSAKTRVDGPLQQFDGNDFVVGVWFMATTFKVSAPPHEVEGTLRMTVDGVELRRIGDGTQPTAQGQT